MTTEFLVQLARNLEHYRPAEATRLATAALQVLAIRLAHELDGDGWIAPNTHQQALLTRIYAFIQQHLGDPELSPGAVAAAHHISVSYLHRLFHAEGDSGGLGFLHPGHFSRAFKAAYGVRPLDYRWSSRLAANGVDGS